MLGWVSLLMDTSSELVHSLLPIFMVSTLGLSITTVGIVEGIAESTALIVKLFSGTLSDYFRRRKMLTIIGYGISTITKPLFPLAKGIDLVLIARFVDRIGKGIRGAPRDAMIGDIAPPEIRGACFGLRQSMDTIGAFLGPILAIAGMLLFANNIRFVLWIAVIPAVFCMLILTVKVEEPSTHHDQKKFSSPFKIKNILQFSSAYWQLVIVAGIFTLARFSEAFLLLKAQKTGLTLSLIPLVIVTMNIIYALSAYPAGILSDTVSRKSMLVIGIVFLFIADLVLGFTNNIGMLFLGIILWGLHLGFTQGLLAAMVTDTAPIELRGTGYGFFNVVCGIAMLVSSIFAGILWTYFGSSMTFFAGALFSMLGLLGLFFVKSDF